MNASTVNGASPCPACGFLVFDHPPGSYEICPVCDWKDDGVQLANPCSGGGANSYSLDEAQRAVLKKHALGLEQVGDTKRDPAWRPLSDTEREWARRAIELNGSPWPNHATEEYYWRNPFETVHTMTDYYDGPRAGIADFEGAPHHYASTWNDMQDEYDDVFVLRPLDEETFRLALEDWAIWLRWERAFYSGATSQDTHPALPDDRARHQALEEQLRGRFPPTGVGFRATAVFRAPPRPKGLLGWVGLQVKWSRCGDA